MFKIIALVILTITFGFDMFLKIRSYLARNNKVPEELSDIYDEETYLKWKKYKAEHLMVDIIFSSISYVITLVLILTNVYALISGGVENVYLSALIVLGLNIGISLVTGTISEYIKTMKIEEKYGFNKSSMKTFVADQIKGLILSLLLVVGSVSLFIALYTNIGDYILIVFTAILFVFVLFISFLYPFFSKIFNKFKPLEEGELREKLKALLEKHNYQVKEIKVMDASRRTRKLNAYFTGFGRTKEIVLYDNLLEKVSPEEIVAIFAHEMGHGLHHDTLKGQIMSFLNIAIIVVFAWLLAKFPQIYSDFGFAGLNYGFAFILLMEIIMPLISIVLGLLSSIRSRKAEYAADKQAYLEGYADELISGLKVLSKENFADLSPDPLVVLLHYSHPTLYQRMKAIEKLKQEEKEVK